MLTLVPWTGVLGFAVAVGSPAAPIMGALLTGLLVATSLALVLGRERKLPGSAPFIALRSASPPDRAAAA